MAKKPKIAMKCKQCGNEPKGESQGSWAVTKTTCEKCGGKVSLIFKE